MVLNWDNSVAMAERILADKAGAGSSADEPIEPMPTPTPLSEVDLAIERREEYRRKEDVANGMIDLVYATAEAVGFDPDVARDFLIKNRRASSEVLDAIGALDPRELNYFFAEVVTPPEMHAAEDHYQMTVRPLAGISEYAALPCEIVIYRRIADLGMPEVDVGSKVLFCLDVFSGDLEEPSILDGEAAWPLRIFELVSESGWGIDPDPTPRPSPERGVNATPRPTFESGDRLGHVIPRKTPPVTASPKTSPSPIVDKRYDEPMGGRVYDSRTRP